MFRGRPSPRPDPLFRPVAKRKLSNFPSPFFREVLDDEWLSEKTRVRNGSGGGLPRGRLRLGFTGLRRGRTEPTQVGKPDETTDCDRQPSSTRHGNSIPSTQMGDNSKFERARSTNRVTNLCRVSTQSRTPSKSAEIYRRRGNLIRSSTRRLGTSK